MLSNYIKVAWRHLLREKVVSLISVVSLSLGIACALLVFVFLQMEWVRDDFHVNAERVFRIDGTNEAANDRWNESFALQSAELGSELQTMLPEVVESVARWGPSFGRLRRDDFTIRFDITYVDSSLFSMFSFDIAYGDRAPFSTPNEIVLTSKTAERYAKGGDVASLIGESFTFYTSGNTPFQVTCTAIIDGPTYRSSLQFEGLVPFDLMAGYQETGDAVLTFAMLERPEDRVALEGALPDLAKRMFAKQSDELRGKGQWSQEEDPFALHTVALNEMLENRTPGDMLRVMSEAMVWIVGVLGGLVLMVGAVNFTVLSLGRAVYRAKEIGLRKVTGAQGGQVIGQHIVEAVLLCVISTCVGVFLADTLMPPLSALFSIPNYELRWSATPIFWVFLLCLPLVVGSLAGFYPAYAASRIEPAAVMRGIGMRARKGRLARSLVVIQFGAAVFLLASTEVMLGQYYHGRAMDRGYDPNSLLVIDVNSDDYELIYPRYRARVIGLPGVEGVAGSSRALGVGANYYRSEEPEMHIFHTSVTPEFASTFGLTIVEGRDFRPNGPLDEVLVNQKLVEEMGWDDPIGQVVPFKYGLVDHPIVAGVVEDFIYLLPMAPVYPFVAHRDTSQQTARVWVRFDRSETGTIVPQLKEAWREVAPAAPTDLEILSDYIGARDEDEIKLFESVGYASSVFGTLISCLGLFGLALHTLATRTKEVGVRKVLGASVPSVFVLLSKHLILLSVAGCVLGSLGSYYVVGLLVQNFAHQEPIGIHHFAVPSAALILLALGSICYHTVRTAYLDPTEELKYE